ncbi:hypothetical protein [Chitinophaga varians]|uniref:hypothetical protein n=1 Tax=Chitinophaga varians TaxID=2202339 RepID=UPI00165F2C11|nr:hypothetical protein [Chitinophaga varians]MBC9911127.1 hypothetical protein [Chitinophaga varians]
MKRLFILILSVGLFSCNHKTNNQRNDLAGFINTAFPGQGQKTVIVIPGTGCGGCISGVEKEAMHLCNRGDVKIIFTGIRSLKILRTRVGDSILHHKNVFIDHDDQFYKVTNDRQDLWPYPVRVTVDGDKLLAISKDNVLP